jgi:MoxR-like ATPase
MKGDPVVRSVEELEAVLAREYYIADREAATVIYLALRLEKPLLLEGPPGAGKTEIAKVLAQGLGMRLIRLQCYEGIDEAKALYQWNEPLQRMYLELLRQEGGNGQNKPWHELRQRLYSTDFLVPGPILRALQADERALLLIDEVDKIGAAFEAFLLEVLSDFQVSIPQLGTVVPKHRPAVILTSNAQRKLTDALRGRCFLLWMDYPTPEREAAIILGRSSDSESPLGLQVARFTAALRNLGMTKPPAIRESLDWIGALSLLGARELGPEVVSLTLPVLLKTRDDIERAAGNIPLLLQLACPVECAMPEHPHIRNRTHIQ